MRRKRVLILIDQATRDGLSQLLLAHYLRRKGVEVFLCNQATVVSSCESLQPDLFFCSWVTTPWLCDYLRSIQHRTRLFLVDQEGGRMGQAAFRRTMTNYNGIKLEIAKAAVKVVTWGQSQAEWLVELGIPRERIAVTGCPRLDPYLLDVKSSSRRTPYVGVTLRADPFTSGLSRIMESMHASNDAIRVKDGIQPSLPHWARFEDWMWRVIAETRHMFLAIDALSRKIEAPIVLRPGPWEPPSLYEFLPKRYAALSVETKVLQHRYVGDAFAVIDASSALGLEALLAKTPVISVVSMIPRLEEHVGGADGARLNSPYRNFYWQPRDMDELADMALKAKRGELPVTRDAAGMKTYLMDCHGWPPPRPASFETGDEILRLLDGPTMPPFDGPLQQFSPTKRSIFRRVPGARWVPHAKLYWQCLTAPDADHLRRYHFFSSLYPHHEEVDRVFEQLWDAFESPRKAPSLPQAAQAA